MGGDAVAEASYLAGVRALGSSSSCGAGPDRVWLGTPAVGPASPSAAFWDIEGRCATRTRHLGTLQAGLARNSSLALAIAAGDNVSCTC